MSQHVMPQIEEYRHRIQQELFHLNKVNAEIVYFLDKYGYLEQVFSGIPNYQDRLFRALASTDHNQRLAYGKQLMQDLWEIELALGVYPFSDVLAEFEFGGQFYRGYRDHVIHQLRVYLLGLYLFYGCKKIQNLFQGIDVAEFLILWKIAALAHDHGYLFEVPDGEENQWVLNKVMPTFDHCVAFPFSGLSEAVRNGRFGETDAPNRNDLINFLIRRNITHNREEEIKRSLEVVGISPRTIGDIRVFRGNNLLEHLSWLSAPTRLSLQDRNGIEAYYDFAALHRPDEQRDRFRDHGITSALFLLLQSEYNCYYSDKIRNCEGPAWKKMGIPNENIEFLMGVTTLMFRVRDSIKLAASAVALHNIHQGVFQQAQSRIIAERDYGLTLHDFLIPQAVTPLAFLLMLVDTLQDWDRPSFAPIDSPDLPRYQTDQDISITLSDERIYISFPNRDRFSFNPLERMKDQLKLSLDRAFIDDLLRETSWKGLGVCYLTGDAQRIESTCAGISQVIPSSKLKELLSLDRKYDHFECSLFLDLREGAHLLRLIVDLISMANTNGGHFVIGINEKDFAPIGLDAKTYIYDSEALYGLLDAFCSSRIILQNQKQKVLIKTAERNEFRWFHIFYVPKSTKLIALTNDGKLSGGTQSLFRKNDIPIRQNGKTIMADRDMILDRFREAKLDGETEMVQSILALQRAGKIPQGPTSDEKPLPGTLPTPDFDRLIGRDNEIRELLENLDNPKRFIITIDGIGGSGKSALAYEVAKNIKNHSYASGDTPHSITTRFDAVVWVTAKTCELTAEGIVPKFSSAVTLDILIDHIAEAIEFGELKNRDFEEKKTSILECLEAFRCLIVIDNLETIPDMHKEEILRFVEEDMPPPSKVIYTTRTKFHEGYSMRVVELEPEDAIVLSRDIAIQCGNYSLAEDRSVLNKVVQRSGRIPLGIRWMISRMSLGYTTMATSSKVMDDHALMRFCFEETFKYLQPNEQRTLFATAVCHFVPTRDNLEFLTGLSRGELDSGLERLESFSLVKIREENVHILPLTKDYSSYQLDQEPVLASELRSKVQNLCRLDETVGEILPVTQKMAMKLYKEAIFEDAQGNLQGALKRLEKALSLSREDYILKGLAEVTDRIGHQEDAFKLYKEYLEAKPEDLEVLVKMASFHRKKENFSKAVQYITRATTFAPGDKDLWYHRGRIEISLSQQHEKNSPAARKYLQAAIVSFQNAVRKPATTGVERNFNSTNYFNIAQCYFWLKDPGNAYEACILGLEENSNNLKLSSLAKRIQSYL